MKYVVYTKYQMYTRDGIKWSNEFIDSKFDTMKEAKERVKNNKSQVKALDKSTGLLHEYTIKEIDETKLDYNDIIAMKSKRSVKVQ